MEKENILKEVNAECKACKECDPSCTGNLMKKILNKKPLPSTANY